MNEILGWSATETAEHIGQRDVSAETVTAEHLAQAEAINPAINALTEILGTEALSRAREIDRTPLPDPVPPLYGVPVTTKINVDQKGCVNSNGLPALADARCDEDAPVVRNLRAGGAVIIGRTNTPEFSLRWCTSNPLHGMTRNPWDERVTPGGSSGGAAVAVAVGIGCIAQGNDLGGSLRYPGFCCGVAALKPSSGRIPAFNPSAVAERPQLAQMMSVQGPIARSVADLRSGLQAMSAGSPDDPHWRPPTPTGPGRRNDAESARIGVCTDLFGDGVDPGVSWAMERARAPLQEAGHAIVEIEPPHPHRLAELWGELQFAEARRYLEPSIRAHGSPEAVRMFEAYLESYRELSLGEFFDAMAERISIQRAWSRMFGKIDALMIPVSAWLPFENDLDFKQPQQIPEILRAQRFLHVINVLGYPAVSIPVGLFEGLPAGVQIVTPLDADALALDIGERLERIVGRIVIGLPARLAI